MLKSSPLSRIALSAMLTMLAALIVSCDGASGTRSGASAVTGGGRQAGDVSLGEGAVMLVIDEDSIDNGNAPNDFSNVHVNDQLATVGLRSPLQYFRDNVGRTVNLFTGDVGDEGWHALRHIPSAWIGTGPTSNGTLNYLAPGPGLGGGPDDGREVLLDHIPSVTPLRATGLAMLVGQTVLAVVYDSEVGINYSLLTGNLMGANLGIVALEVLEVQERRDASTGSLPRVTVRILDADAIAEGSLFLFANAPVPRSSSEPFDVAPPVVVSAVELNPAP